MIEPIVFLLNRLASQDPQMQHTLQRHAGKTVKITLTDISAHWYFLITRSGLCIIDPIEQSDTTVSTSLIDLHKKLLDQRSEEIYINDADECIHDMLLALSQSNLDCFQWLSDHLGVLTAITIQEAASFIKESASWILQIGQETLSHHVKPSLCHYHDFEKFTSVLDHSSQRLSQIEQRMETYHHVP